MIASGNHTIILTQWCSEYLPARARIGSGDSPLLISYPVFHVSGLDHRRLGVRRLPGDGLFFVLFHVLSPHTIVCAADAGQYQNMPRQILPGPDACAYPNSFSNNSLTWAIRPGAKGLSSPALSRKARKYASSVARFSSYSFSPDPGCSCSIW